MQIEKSLRERLLDELGETHSERGYPTWWWAHSARRGNSTVTHARKELQAMEKEGLVRRTESKSNQIQWVRCHAN